VVIDKHQYEKEIWLQEKENLQADLAVSKGEITKQII
jgi:hypothetical protein